MKLLLLAAGGLIVGSLLKSSYNLVNNLRVYATIGGLPTIKKGWLSVPLSLTFHNPEPIGLRVQDMQVTIYKWDGTKWGYIANNKPNVGSLLIRASASTTHTVHITAPLLDTVLELISLISEGFKKENFKASGWVSVEGAKINFDTTFADATN